MNIYVGNVARAVTEDMLQGEFSQFGEVLSVKMIKDKFTGELRGFAFVDMPNASEAQAAIDGMNGKEMGGRALRVNEARAREERPRTGGGMGGNRFGGNRDDRGPRSGGMGGGFKRY